MAYIGKSPSTGVRNRFIYTATAGQTTFSGTDDHNRTLSYTDAEFTDVFLNGVKLDKSDYTATSGTSIVLDSGATVGDTLEILGFDTFSVFSGEFSQDVTVGGTLTASADATVTGDLTVDTNTLHVDSTNNRVGVGTISPARELSIGDGTGSPNIQLLAANTGNSRLEFGDTDDSDVGEIQYLHGDNAMLFHVNASERMRINSDGYLLVGKTAASTSTVGVEARGNGLIVGTRDGNNPLILDRLSNDGAIALFRKDSTNVAQIGVVSGVYPYIGGNAGGSGDVFLVFISNSTQSIRPSTSSGSSRDNAIRLGYTSARFSVVYAATASINTSDSNEKQQVASLTDAEMTAAKSISALFKTFKWNDAVTNKGSNARTHAGVIAQDVQQAMTDAGLDAADYAFWCSDTWWETQTEVPAVEAVAEVLDDDGNVVTEAVEAQDAYTRTDTFETAEEAPEGATERTRLGIRYAELLAFIGAATEQRLADIETRLTALEAE